MPELHCHAPHVVLRGLSESARLYTAVSQCVAVRVTANTRFVLMLLLLSGFVAPMFAT